MRALWRLALRGGSAGIGGVSSDMPDAATARQANLTGAALMVVSTLTFVCNDAAMKYLTQELPLYQAMMLRGLFVVILLGGHAAATGRLRLAIPRRDTGRMGWRALGEVGSAVLYLTALQQMGMASASAIMQSLPLLVTLAAALFLGERLGMRRMTAIAVGFAGVLIILRPGTGAFDIWALAALASVFLIVLRDMVTRGFSSAVSSTTIAIYAAGSVGLFGLAMWDETWRIPTLAELGLLALASAMITVGYITAIATMRVGEVSFVAPFRYSSLIWAVLLGLVVFGDWPDVWTQLGSVLIVAAGMYSIWREGRLPELHR